MSWVDRYRRHILIGLAVVLLTGLVAFFIRQPQAGTVEIILPTATATPEVPLPPSESSARIRVYVCGAVAVEDVYLLPPMSIVKDAILAAGGATEEADLLRINLARELRDQEQVYVPAKGEETILPILNAADGSLSEGAHSQPRRINLNTAAATELESLPGIGPALSERIIAHRPYRAVHEIINVPGIGEKTYEKLKDLVTVD